MKKNRIFAAIFFLILFLTAADKVQAICPVCTVAVGAGVGLSRYLGVDDTVTGLWIGGLSVSMILWTINFLERKNIKFKARGLIITGLYYLIIVLPLYWNEIVGHPFNKFWGMDKLMLGIFFGSIFFLAGAMLHFSLKKKNEGKVYFPFQKVAFSISPVIILSVVFYFITKQ